MKAPEEVIADVLDVMQRPADDWSGTPLPVMIIKALEAEGWTIVQAEKDEAEAKRRAGSENLDAVAWELVAKSDAKR